MRPKNGFAPMVQWLSSIGLGFLVILLTTIIVNGRGAFQQTFLSVPVYLDPAKLDKKGDRNPEDIAKVSTFGYGPLIQAALLEQVRGLNIDTPLTDAKDMKALIFGLCGRRSARCGNG